MTVQMTVRISDENAEFIDESVAAGEAKSRADMIDRALRHERENRIFAELARRGEHLYPDLAGLGAWSPEREYPALD